MLARRSAALLLATLALCATPTLSPAGPLPERDASSVSTAAPMRSLAARNRAQAAIAGIARPASYDERYGVPTMLWADRTSPATSFKASAAKPSIEGAARRHLGLVSDVYGLKPTDTATAPVRWLHDTGNGGVIVAFKQQVDGVEVFRDEVKVLMDRDLSLVAVSGYIPGQDLVQAAAGSPFALAPEAALTIGLEDFAGAKVPAGLRAAGKADGGYQLFDAAMATGDLPDEVTPAHTLRVRKTFFHLPGRLVPAYQTEFMAPSQSYSYVIDANSGEILFRHDIMASDLYGYRVYGETSGALRPYDGPQGNDPTPHPTGLPDFYAPSFLSPNLLTIQNTPFSRNDPWLATGATTLTGNNVDAYADLVSPDGFNTGDLRATPTAANTFDRTYNHTLAPSASSDQRMAAITQLFYNNNFFHDWYYDAGFDEASGNGQTDNFGRGGFGADPIKAEAQDYGGTNNANMSTPSDGASGRMQMYVFTPAGASSVTATGAATGNFASGVASGFGPQVFNLTGDLVLGVDTVSPFNDGCTSASAATLANFAQLNGKVCLLDRGTCSFLLKAQAAQSAGAIALIIADNAAGSTAPAMGGTSSAILIPVLSVTQAAGNALKAGMLSGTVTVNLSRQASVSRDGSLDNQIVAHEWGHFISNRLVGDASGLSTNMAGGLGEGWADFHAMLMSVRAEDIGVGANANWNGVYGLAGYALYPSVGTSNAYYYGIRRVPYSTDLTKNGLTFKHIANNVALPATVPTAFGLNGANNAEVHNTGEVWCTMLWECYASLLRDNVRLTFAQAQSRMKDYLVAAYKLTPNAPTLLEARDALLAAAYARDITDFGLFYAAFAKRGAGVGAIAPDRFSATNIGGVESFVVGGDLSIASRSLAMDLRDCDGDARLDNGELGRVLVTLRNTGTISLNNTTVSISSSNPHVTFPQGTTVRAGHMAPYATASTYIVVAFDGASTAETADLTITAADPGMITGPRTSTLSMYTNVDDGPSANENAEGNTSGWTAATTNPEGTWSVVQGATGINHLFYGADIGNLSDHRWTSPPIVVGATGPASFTFKTAFDFEKSGTTYYDGGVIEISNDNGVTWTDLGTSMSPGYGGVLTTGNPLAGRNALVSTSTSYPALQTYTVSLGSGYAGQTIRIRFRVVCDGGVGAGGWYVDDLVFTNIANFPFFALIDDIVACAPVGVDETAPHDLSFAVTGANPAMGRTAFRFGLPKSERAELGIFDITGRRVATLASGTAAAGWHTAAWTVNDDGTTPAAGIYFARLTTDSRTLGSRIVMLK